MCLLNNDERKAGIISKNSTTIIKSQMNIPVHIRARTTQQILSNTPFIIIILTSLFFALCPDLSICILSDGLTYIADHTGYQVRALSRLSDLSFCNLLHLN